MNWVGSGRGVSTQGTAKLDRSGPGPACPGGGETWPWGQACRLDFMGPTILVHITEKQNRNEDLEKYTNENE